MTTLETAADQVFRHVEVVGTEFRVTRADGILLTGLDLVGVRLTLGDPSGERMVFRIDAILPDPKDPDGETILYEFKAQDTSTGEWQNICSPDPDGLAMGFPLSGIWTPTGEHLPADKAFSLTCTSGASAKCVRMGYKPWQTTPDGTSLWPYHQACTRMMRADYCGDGSSYTRPGIPIDVYDRYGIQTADPSLPIAFEAAWGPEGAVCVHRVRIPELITLDGLVRSCPNKLKTKIGSNCTESSAAHIPNMLLMNKSP